MSNLNDYFYTAGYEGLTLEEFVYQLKINGVEVLIDIREIPISRKKGFSKKRLEQALIEVDIQYIHFKVLGSPSPIRKKLREDGDFDFFFKEFEKHLRAHKEVLIEIKEKLQRQIICLLCYEKSHESCHRKIVADELVNIHSNEMMVKHL